MIIIRLETSVSKTKDPHLPPVAEMSLSLSHVYWKLCTCTGLCQMVWAEGCGVLCSYPRIPCRQTGIIRKIEARK